MNKPDFIMLVGLPGSGKSTFAKELAKDGTVICSSDEVRERICGDKNCQDNNNEVFKILHREIKENLRSGKSCIYDATNISSKRRRAFLAELKNIYCVKTCIIIATLYEKCQEFNSKRVNPVPKEVIKKMYLNWNTPYWFEGWDDIEVEYRNFEEREYFGFPKSYVQKFIDYNQDNSNHNLSLGNHLKETRRIVNEWEWITGKEDISLKVAALLHDIGKPFTKCFIDSKGNESQDAHYYQHHCVGAYDSLFFKTISNTIDHSILINLHMMPYFWEQDKEYGEKTRLKYKRLWGEDLYEKVMNLHNADKLAH